MIEQQPKRQITITFDETDLDEAALQYARRQAIGALVRRGVTDLNALQPADFDLMFAVWKLAYENHKASRDHRFGTFNWQLEYHGQPIGGVT